MVTRYSLETLASIIAIPRFLRKLRILTFSDADVECKKMSYILDRALFEKLSSGASSTCIAVGKDHESYAEASRQQTEYLKNVERVKSRRRELEDELFIGDSIAIRLIAQALDILKGAGVCPIIQIFGINSKLPIPRAFGLSKLQNHMGVDIQLADDFDSGHKRTVIDAVLCAIG